MQQINKADLKDFITISKQRLADILKRLEWSEEEVLKDFNSNSKACSNKEIIQKPCSPKITTYPDSCITQNSVIIGSRKLQEILQNPEIQAPLNFAQLQANFTREQKLKIYDYVIENTEKLQHFKEALEVEGELSLADILAQKKLEEKRKKRRFRKSKPTHIEEVRSLVELQMQALQQFMGDKIKKEEENLLTRENLNSKEDNYAKDRSQNERNYYKEYYNKGRYRESFAEQIINKYPENTKDFKGSYSKELSYGRKRRSRSRSKEKRKRSRSRHRGIIYKSERYERSCSKEISHKRSRRARSGSKDRSRRSRSRNKKDSYESKRRSTSPTKDYLKERRKRNHSRNKERCSQREKNDYHQKQQSRGNYDYYYERKQNKHYRKYSKSPETSNSKKYYQEETFSKEYDDTYGTYSSNYDKYHGYHESLSPNREESPQNKYCKHKKKKHNRERS